MLFGDLLPTALAVWMPRRAARSDIVWNSCVPPAAAHRVQVSAAALPRGVIAVAPETHRVLDAVKDFARSRFVELQVAVEPGLVAQVDAGTYRRCLDRLLLEAVGRASSGVLITGMRHAGGVEVAVLDDGSTPGGAPTHVSERTGADIPPGATLDAEYEPGRGTTIRLRLPQPDRSVVRPEAAVTEAVAAFADF